MEIEERNDEENASHNGGVLYSHECCYRYLEIC